MKINKTLFYKISLLTLASCFITIFIIIFALNEELLGKAYIDYGISCIAILVVILARIGIVFLTTVYLMKKWFNQDKQFLTDIPFLLGMFFFTLIFGKLSDLLWDLTFHYLSDELVLIFLKVRFYIIMLEVAPLIYLGFEIIFFRLEFKYEKLKSRKYMNRIRSALIELILGGESILIIFLPTITSVGLLLPVILIPSLMGIVYIFYLAYKGGRLNVVKPRILSIGFLLYLFSNIFRPILPLIMGETPNYIIVVEIIDLVIFIFIFFGMYKKND